MQPVVRRKLPARLRCMLTDIGPKEENALDPETEQAPVEIDGIVLPRRGASNTNDLLAPAKTNDTKNDGPMPKVCGLCLSQPYRYTCPRCNITYCSLTCYRSLGHSGCSEEFYKESVFEELKNSGLTEKESKEKMHDILLRLRKNEGQMENLTQQLGEEVEPGGPEALKLLSRLAEIQASGEGNTEEVQEILLKLRDIDKGGDGSNVHGLDDDDDDEEEDMADRLAGLDIDSLSEEELWALLGKEDREKFEQLVNGGAIGGLIPIWKPWWEAHDKPKEVLMEVLSEQNTGQSQDEASVDAKDNKVKEVIDIKSLSERTGGATSDVIAEKCESAKVKHENKGKKPSKQKNKSQDDDTNMQGKNKPSSGVPPVNMSKIPPLHSLTKNPSPLLGNTLVNVLYGYTFSLCLFNGDLSEEEMIQDFCQMVLSISEGLSTARVFSSPQEALEVALTAVSTAGYFDREDPQAQARAVEAVAHVLSGQSACDPVRYCLAALSELKGALGKARALLPKDGEGAELRKRSFQAMKKCEFLQSWAKENSQGVKTLAASVWGQYLKRDSERRILEVDKRETENRRKNKGPLIEEITTNQD